MNITCPYRNCEQPIGITVDQAGTEVACPACNRPMRVPELAEFPAHEINAAKRAQSFTPKFFIEHLKSQPSEKKSLAGCPHCREALDEKTQRVVQQLIELKDSGAVVREIPIACSCEEKPKFRELIWLTENGNGNLRETKTPITFRPPLSTRQSAKRISDAGVAAAKDGDVRLARNKWLRAAETDKLWSVPFFNLSILSLKNGDDDAAEVFLNMAEGRAERGKGADDAQVKDQIASVRARIQRARNGNGAGTGAALNA